MEIHEKVLLCVFVHVFFVQGTWKNQMWIMTASFNTVLTNQITVKSHF